MSEQQLEGKHPFLLDTSQLTVEQRTDLLEKKILVLHYQQERLVSDVESEKGTRARLNSDMLAGVRDLEKRVRLLERAIWSGIGVVIFFEFLLKYKLP